MSTSEYYSHRCRQVDGLEAEHYFRAKPSMIAAALQPKMKRGAMLRIHQELSSISTNLPLSVASSIFVVVDETRSDMLRALITGPKSTPCAPGQAGLSGSGGKWDRR